MSVQFGHYFTLSYIPWISCIYGIIILHIGRIILHMQGDLPYMQDDDLPYYVRLYAIICKISTECKIQGSMGFIGQTQVDLKE